MDISAQPESSAKRMVESQGGCIQRQDLQNALTRKFSPEEVTEAIDRLISCKQLYAHGFSIYSNKERRDAALLSESSFSTVSLPAILKQFA